MSNACQLSLARIRTDHPAVRTLNPDELRLLAPVLAAYVGLFRGSEGL